MATASITKKRSILKGQMTNLRAAVDRGELSSTNVKLRVQRLTELFHQYEELHVELEENEDKDAALVEIQNTFYQLISSIAETPAPGTSRGNPDVSHLLSGFTNSTIIERQKPVKLPVSDLPKFDGNYDHWLSFKNSFKSMIDARNDIDDLAKFLYLRNSLTGSAERKLDLLSATPENYKVGWDILTSLYEKKRLLISKHYSAFFDNDCCKITQLPATSIEALEKLIDDAQQNKAMLENLGVVPDEGMIVCLLERSIPRELRVEWDKTLKPNVMPSFNEFYMFVHEHLVRMDNMKPQTARSQAGRPNKRLADKSPRDSKIKRSNSGARALVTDIANSCGFCGQNHRINQCANFEKLNTQQRWDAVKEKRLCFNCLRAHKAPCKATHCKKCTKFHNTLLHNEKRNDTKSAQHNSAKFETDKSTNTA